MSDLALRTKICPLTMCVTEKSPSAESLGSWRADELFSMLDEFSKATLERVDMESDAEFIIEMIATPDQGITSVQMRESILVMTSERIGTSADLATWESLAARFAEMIDTAAECYAAPAANSGRRSPSISE